MSLIKVSLINHTVCNNKGRQRYLANTHGRKHPTLSQGLANKPHHGGGCWRTRSNLKVLEMKISHSGFNVMKITVKWMKGRKREGKAERSRKGLLKCPLQEFLWETLQGDEI